MVLTIVRVNLLKTNKINETFIDFNYIYNGY